MQRTLTGLFLKGTDLSSRQTQNISNKNTLTMYMGDPHSVAAIMLFWRYRAKPKSAAKQQTNQSEHTLVLLLQVTKNTIVGYWRMPV